MENLVFSLLYATHCTTFIGILRILGTCDTYEARELFGIRIGLLVAGDTEHRHRIELNGMKLN